MNMNVDLQILDQREATLRELAAKYRGLAVAGVGDTKGLAILRAARITLKGSRVQIEKDAKQLRDGALSFQRTVIAREKELINIIAPVEDELQVEEDRIEAEKAEIRKQKEREVIELTQVRVNALSKFGHGIDFFEAREMTDEKFNELLTQVEVNYKQELERKVADEQRRKNEQATIDKQRAELEYQRQKQECAAREQSEREAKIRAEQETERARINAERQMIEQEKADIEARKQREEQERQRVIELESAKKEAAERARIEAEQKAQRDADEKHRAELAAKAESERLERLRPDKEKILALAESLRAMRLPDVESKEAIRVMGLISGELIKLSESIQARASKL